MAFARVSNKVGGLKLRSMPNMAGEVVDEAAPGDVVEVLGYAGHWAHVRYRQQYGYMYNEHLEQLPEAAQPAPQPEWPFWLFYGGVAIAIVLAVWFATWMLGP